VNTQVDAERLPTALLLKCDEVQMLAIKAFPQTLSALDEAIGV
jgi:hypothetical protein